MSAPRSAQIVISYDESGLKIEAPGANGARRKVEGVSFDELPLFLRSELVDQLDSIKRAERDRVRDQQTQNIAYASEYHPGIVRKIWGTNATVFNARLRKHLNGSAGNLADQPKTPTSSSPRPKRTSTADAVDIDLD